MYRIHFFRKTQYIILVKKNSRVSPRRECLSLPCLGQVLQQVEEDEDESEDLKTVGHHRDGGQILEVLDRAQGQHGEQQEQHVKMVVHVPEMVVHDLKQGNKVKVVLRMGSTENSIPLTNLMFCEQKTK